MVGDAPPPSVSSTSNKSSLFFFSHLCYLLLRVSDAFSNSVYDACYIFSNQKVDTFKINTKGKLKAL